VNFDHAAIVQVRAGAVKPDRSDSRLIRVSEY
jgi:hypothetical protein